MLAPMRNDKGAMVGTVEDVCVLGLDSSLDGTESTKLLRADYCHFSRGLNIEYNGAKCLRTYELSYILRD